jgi:hypothetical protein
VELYSQAGSSQVWLQNYAVTVLDAPALKQRLLARGTPVGEPSVPAENQRGSLGSQRHRTETFAEIPAGVPTGRQIRQVKLQRSLTAGDPP